MIKKVYKFDCDDCKTVSEYATKDEAKARGWAIGHGEKTCYCPACAFRHRNTGRSGAKPNQIKGQISISEVQNSA